MSGQERIYRRCHQRRDKEVRMSSKAYYMYTSNTHPTGNKVEDYELTRNSDHSTTYGASGRCDH